MRSLWKKFNTWRCQRHEYTPERWAKMREKGRGWFMLRETFIFTVLGVSMIDVGGQIFHYGHEFWFGFYIFQFAISGLVMGYNTWGDNEAKYQKALKSPPQTSTQLP